MTKLEKFSSKFPIHRALRLNCSLFVYIYIVNNKNNQVSCLVLCHTRELAWQIAREYERFCKHLPEVKVMVIYGGLPVQKQRETLKNDTPHIVVGCPGRVMQLVREGDLKVDKLQYFVLDECDKMLDQKGTCRQCWSAVACVCSVFCLHPTQWSYIA